MLLYEEVLFLCHWTRTRFSFPQTTKIRIYITILLWILATEVMWVFGSGGVPLNLILIIYPGIYLLHIDLNHLWAHNKGLLPKLPMPKYQVFGFILNYLIKTGFFGSCIRKFKANVIWICIKVSILCIIFACISSAINYIIYV